MNGTFVPLLSYRARGHGAERIHAAGIHVLVHAFVLRIRPVITSSLRLRSRFDFVHRREPVERQAGIQRNLSGRPHPEGGDPGQSKVDLALYDTGRGAKALRGSFQVLFLYDVSDQLRLTELASGAEARAGARVPVLGLQPARVTRRRADIIIVPTGVFQNCSKILCNWR